MEHVLWRVLNGELDFTVPIKVVVLFVGTNNTDCTAQNIFEGICEIVRVIREKLGNVTILLPVSLTYLIIRYLVTEIIFYFVDSST